jgi:hypothetical protein
MIVYLLLIGLLIPKRILMSSNTGCPRPDSANCLSSDAHPGSYLLPPSTRAIAAYAYCSEGMSADMLAGVLACRQGVSGGKPCTARNAGLRPQCTAIPMAPH